MIARLLLEELKVDRVEVASARVSEGERNAVKIICDWASRRDLLPRVEVLGFVDGHASVDWICSTGCRVINLLCKGSEKHCHYQLKKTPQEHIDDILRVVDYAQEQGMWMPCATALSDATCCPTRWAYSTPCKSSSTCAR